MQGWRYVENANASCDGGAAARNVSAQSWSSLSKMIGRQPVQNKRR